MAVNIQVYLEVIRKPEDGYNMPCRTTASRAKKAGGESMLQMELAVCQKSPYRDIALFQHYIG